ncbi:MAG: DUF2490 domain-containing protein [Chlamydiae bacterium]|nr:DUF2490 domain-containing protein [Chlamydiota bacterium]MBI3266970.1 DUF2490 domain-containing protein [Chlamydiota bacterium]
MKRGSLKAWLLGLGIMCCTSPLLATLNGDGDFQYWNTEAIEGKMTDQWKAYAEAEFRFGDNVSEFYYQHTQLEIAYKITDWLELAPAYRQVWELFTSTKEEDDDWFTEYRPMLNATLKHKWEGWDISDRNRLEFREFEVKDDAIRYRNKLTLKSPWKWTHLGINPFIADEVFFQEDAGFNRNRLQVGVGMKIIEHLEGELYYLWQTSEKGDEWIDFHVIGTKLKFKF